MEKGLVSRPERSEAVMWKSLWKGHKGWDKFKKTFSLQWGCLAVLLWLLILSKVDGVDGFFNRLFNIAN